MQQIISFLVDNWQVILSAILSIITVIIAILRKRPVTNLIDHELVDVLSYLPSWINEAEERFTDGKEKFAWVLQCVSDYMRGCGLTDSEKAIWLQIIGSHVENILSTPQKKD